MLPIYEAIGFEKVMEGGSTRPWLVNVLEGHKAIPYVVKLYTEKYNEENNSVLKEIICSNLANQFEIETPSPALIRFSEDFISTLPETLQTELNRKDQRLKFGTRLIESGYENFSPQLSGKYLRDFDLGTIYAFDNLIMNLDRKIEKPNLFFRNDRVVLLDHEQTLATTPGAIESIDGKRKWPYWYRKHLFYENLVSMSEKEKSTVFDTFTGYLESLVNFNELEDIYHQLEENDLPIDQYFDFRDYFRAVEANKTALCRIIRETINE